MNCLGLSICLSFDVVLVLLCFPRSSFTRVGRACLGFLLFSPFSSSTPFRWTLSFLFTLQLLRPWRKPRPLRLLHSPGLTIKRSTTGPPTRSLMNAPRWTSSKTWRPTGGTPRFTTSTHSIKLMTPVSLVLIPYMDFHVSFGSVQSLGEFLN